MGSAATLPRMDNAFLAEPRWGMTSLSAVGGVWSVAVALAPIGRYATPRRASGIRATMISALKMIADRIALSGLPRRITQGC